jgi:hypothetical protein
MASSVKYKAPSALAIKSATDKGEYIVITEDGKNNKKKSIANYDKIWFADRKEKKVNGKTEVTQGDPRLIFNSAFHIVGTREALESVYPTIIRETQDEARIPGAMDNLLRITRAHEISSAQKGDFDIPGTLAYKALADSKSAKKETKKEDGLIGDNVKVNMQDFITLYRMARPLQGTRSEAKEFIIKGAGPTYPVLKSKQGSKKSGKESKPRASSFERYESLGTNSKTNKLEFMDLSDSGDKLSMRKKEYKEDALPEVRKSKAIGGRFLFTRVPQLEAALREVYGDNWRQNPKAAGIYNEGLASYNELNNQINLSNVASVPLQVGGFAPATTQLHSQSVAAPQLSLQAAPSGVQF